ncbi:MAG: DUF2066 domain-containing protein [Pseudohongiellaceae bacterium]
MQYYWSMTILEKFSSLSIWHSQARLAVIARVSLLLAVLGSSNQWVSALQVMDLYSHKLQVVSESSSDRNRAFSDALAAVIVKVTGEQRWLLDPAIIQAVNNAASYVERVTSSVETKTIEVLPEIPTEQTSGDPLPQDGQSALSESSPSPDGAEVVPETQVVEQRFINVEFSESLINELLLEAKIPLWDANRPSVLVWMALQDEAGERSFLNREEHSDIVELIQAFAQTRGLPIIFPVLDFEDRRNLNEDAIWSLDEETIRSASVRYGADSIMSGRLHFTAGGELVGVWQFMFQDQLVRFDSVDLELESYINAPLDKITTQLANFFAIVPEPDRLQLALLRVDGVGNLQDYSSLLSYITNLGLVEGVTTKSLEGQRLELSLSLVGEPNQLAELIALDRDLLPISHDEGEEGGTSFHYRWTR